MGVTETDDLTISFNARRCIHARKCVLGLPKAFVPEMGREWIQAGEASTDDMVKVIEACPSGALSYTRKDGGAGEVAPQVNTVRLWEHGPVELHGNLEMPDGSTRMRAVLCRCGASKAKPYCDNSHLDMKFKASSEPQTDAETADVPIPAAGALKVLPIKDGPLMLEGPMEIIAGSGRRVRATEKAFLCRCGASANKPFCDGRHKEIGFEAD